MQLTSVLQCDTVLRLSPGDVDALACKAIAQLQLGDYDEAAKVLSHKQLQGQMHFERVRFLCCTCRLADQDHIRHVYFAASAESVCISIVLV